MPDFTNPIIVSAMISVGGVVVAAVANLLYNRWYRKADFNDRCFFEAYNRRLAVYEDVIKELGALGKPREALTRMSARGFSTKVMQTIHALDGLLVRLYLYGSPGSRGNINLLHVKLCRMINPEPSANLLGKKADAGAFLADIEQARIDFTDFVSGETGKNLVDEKIMKVAKKITNGAKRMKQQTNKSARNKHGPE
jgi:hypothetical protein